MKRVLSCSILLIPLAALALSPEARRQIEADWARQETVARQLEIGSPEALQGVIARGHLMIADMRRLGENDAAARAESVLREVEQAARTGKADNSQLYMQARWALRELAFANPKLDFDQVVFVKRQWPKYNHQCSHRVGEPQIPGANLCVLKGLSPDGELREILSGEHARGGIGRFDLSYDGTRIVFPHAVRRPVATRYDYDGRKGKGRACFMYDIYEVNVDGTGLRQLTDDPTAEDTEPIYLPDGRIAFMSSREGRLVQCGDWALACGLYSMAPDGSDLRRITEPKEGEFFPGMLDDGRIIYTRWDYVMKGFNVIQQLWAVNPDGRRAALVYGDHFAFLEGPIGFYVARQVPGTRKVICVGAGHHNTGVGPIMRVDLDQNRGTRSSMVNLTPEVG